MAAAPPTAPDAWLTFGTVWPSATGRAGLFSRGAGRPACSVNAGPALPFRVEGEEGALPFREPSALAAAPRAGVAYSAGARLMLEPRRVSATGPRRGGRGRWPSNWPLAARTKP